MGFSAVCLLSAQTPDAPIKIGDVTVFGSMRDRVYDWNWFTPTSGRND